MTSINEYLDSHFDEDTGTLIAGLLRKSGLDSIFYNTDKLLNQQNGGASEISFILSALLVEIKQKVHSSLSTHSGKEISLIYDFTSVYLGDFFSRKKTDAGIILNSLKKNIGFHNKIHVPVSGNVIKGVDFEKLFFLVKVNGKKNTAVTADVSNDKRFTWTDKGRLEELVHQLKERKWIKHKSGLFNLFTGNYCHRPVFWNNEKIPQLAYLLYKLYSVGFISISGNKGYFSLAERQFVCFDGSILKKNSLKKTCCIIRKESARYAAVIEEIELIIQCISRNGTKGL